MRQLRAVRLTLSACGPAHRHASATLAHGIAQDAAAVVERVRPEGIDFLVVNAGTATPVHDVNTADIDLCAHLSRSLWLSNACIGTSGRPAFTHQRSI